MSQFVMDCSFPKITLGFSSKGLFEEVPYFLKYFWLSTSMIDISISPYLHKPLSKVQGKVRGGASLSWDTSNSLQGGTSFLQKLIFLSPVNSIFQMMWNLNFSKVTSKDWKKSSFSIWGKSLLILILDVSQNNTTSQRERGCTPAQQPVRKQTYTCRFPGSSWFSWSLSATDFYLQLITFSTWSSYSCFSWFLLRH